MQLLITEARIKFITSFEIATQQKVDLVGVNKISVEINYSENVEHYISDFACMTIILTKGHCCHTLNEFVLAIMMVNFSH